LQPPFDELYKNIGQRRLPMHFRTLSVNGRKNFPIDNRSMSFFVDGRYKRGLSHYVNEGVKSSGVSPTATRARRKE
jgi:hypothetical protein